MAVHKVLKRAWGTAAEIAAAILADREIVVDTDSYGLVLGDGAATGGKTRFRGEPTGATPYTAPLTGATITCVQGERHRIIDPAGTIAALTVTLPPSPQDGDVWEGVTTHTISTLTVNGAGGASVNAGSFTPAPNTGFSWMFRASGAAWFRRY